MISLSKKPFISDFIPEEIIANILTRLPVKSLLRFKCISKQWLSLISSPRFVKTHLLTYSPNFPRIITYCGHRYLHFSAYSLVSESVPDATQIDELEYSVSFIGSCNGLFVILVGDIEENDLYMFNPCTGNSNKLPPVNFEDDIAWGGYGFCYNESKDDYVVIGIFVMYSTGLGHEYDSRVTVYSPRTNSWEIIGGDFTNAIPAYDIRCKFVAGRFHLCTCSLDSLDDDGPPVLFDIVSFDMGNGVQEMIQQPDYGDGVVELSLEVLGGCICVLCSKETHADVWVMKEYGVEASWCKTVTIPYSFNSPRKMYTKPLIISPSGEILLVYRSRIVVYDPKDNSLKVPGTCNLGEFKEADVYVESLVWPTQDEIIGGE